MSLAEKPYLAYSTNTSVLAPLVYSIIKPAFYKRRIVATKTRFLIVRIGSFML